MAVDQVSTRARAAVAALVAATVAMLVAVPVAAEPQDSTQYVKYYTVASSYQGAPETLTEISERFLGSAKRSVEIYNLNAGRTQADHGKLSDPAKLHAGWQLVLPWDAVGSGVRYGLLPAGASAPPTTTAKPGTSHTGSDKAPGGPASVPSSAPPKPTNLGGKCASAASSGDPSNWAALRLAPDQAWSRSRGKDQLVAIVDSGADGSLPQLGRHVALGADLVSGTGRGNTDCLGTGTSMTSLVVAQADKGGNLSGLAPDATVLPVRIVTTSPKARPVDEAAGIEVAVSSGATVIALGSYVDVTDTSVAKAIAAAVAHDIVVVTAAPGTSAPAYPAGTSGSAVLRVGGVGVDGQLADTYRSGAVDVVAPGLNVATLGVTGTGTLASSGTSFAVAYAAAEAALVRAAYPGLSAAQVGHRVAVTADKMSKRATDDKYGHGMIDPAASVTRNLPEERSPAADAGDQSLSAGTLPAAGRTSALVIVGLIGLVAAALLVLRIRRLVRPRASRTDDDPAPEQDATAEKPAAEEAVVPSGGAGQPTER